MRVAGNTLNPTLTILCCTHGDEVFGKRVFDRYFADIEKYPELLIILCNEEAYRLGLRQVDSNLNRIYPGDPNGDSEHCLAHQITQLMMHTRFMIDIHTTESSLDTYAPIISTYTPEVARILNHTDASHIFKMPENAGATIDAIASGVGLEFSYDFSQTVHAVDIVHRVVVGLLNNKRRKPKRREIYHFGGKIPLDVDIPITSGSFQPFVLDGQTVHPFLINGTNYATTEGHQGFYASSVQEVYV